MDEVEWRISQHLYSHSIVRRLFVCLTYVKCSDGVESKGRED